MTNFDEAGSTRPASRLTSISPRPSPRRFACAQSSARASRHAASSTRASGRSPTTFRAGDVLAARHFLRVPGLHPRVDDDRALVRDVVAHERRSAAWMSAAGSNRVNVVHRKFMALRAARAGSSLSTRAASRRTPDAPPAARGLAVSRVRRRADDEAAAAEHAHVGDVVRRRRRRAELARQLAHGIAQPEPHALRPLVDLAARCSRACPSTGSRTRRGPSPDSCARARARASRGSPSGPRADRSRAGTWSATAALRRGCGTRSPSPRARSAA
jgi:hypothetical protein